MDASASHSPRRKPRTARLRGRRLARSALPHWFVRAPDHLGDGVLTLPLVRALAERARLTVAAPRWGEALYGAHAAVQAPGPPPGDVAVAVLVKPAFRALWRTRAVPRRIGWPTDHRTLGLTDVVPLDDRAHRVEQIAALAAPLDVGVTGLPRFEVAPVGRPGVVLLPLSASGPPVEWQGYRALADALVRTGAAVRFAAGPGQSRALAAIAGPHPMLPELGIRALSAVMAAADAVVGNDSGLTHLAAAARRGAGRPVSDVVGIVGSTDPAYTGAPGATWLVGSRPSCAPCYAKRCRSRLECLDVSVEEVLATLAARSTRGEPA